VDAIRPTVRERDRGLPPWAGRTAEELARELETDLGLGLQPAEARRRQGLFGLNEIVRNKRVSPARILVSQFTNFMVLVLLGAAAVSYIIGEAADVAAILAIVVLNAVLGFAQEYRAEQALERLRELAAPTARVVRGDKSRTEVVAARELVPGDLVLVEAGDRVPADLRVVEAHVLRTQEASLTGESAPVDKTTAAPLGEVSSLADLSCALFMGTEVTSGRGRALVVATGMETEFGKIAGLIQEAGDAATPLQRRMEQLGRYLVLACLVISGLVVWAGVMRGEPVGEMFLAGVSLAVAAIPEGLPAVVTVLLALGVQRMIRRQVIVRKLPAVETLGCATIVCTDKTGTLTQNEMTARRLWTPAGLYASSGEGFSPRGRLRVLPGDGALAAGRARDARGPGDPALRLLLVGGVLCSDARLEGGHGGQPFTVHGDPTEGALLVAGVKAGLDRATLEPRFPRVAELPFTPERRRMTTVHAWTGPAAGGPSENARARRVVAFCKGAPDTVLELCSHYQDAGTPSPLTPPVRERALAAADQLAASGLRVLAVAYRRLEEEVGREPSPDRVERNLILAGLVGLADPPRPEVRGAIDVCRRAGVKVSMVTGDHPATALAVAREIRLLDPGLSEAQQVLTGRELDLIPDRVLARRAAEVRVWARVSPGDKLTIVRALRRAGEVVAMTGDGVNDAPAVREADIGVAMGRSGTAVTKEASDMVLADDNFASIVAALEEGRTIYDNIRRSIRYLLSCNTGEILTMLIGALFQLPLPLLPLQILWVNLVTDGLPAMALGLQAPEPDVATRPPRPPREGIFARRLGVKILGRGFIIGLSTIAIYVGTLHLTGWDLPLARTMAFATLCLSQLIHAFDCRSETRALSEIPVASNWYLLAGVACSLGLLLASIYVPALSPLFHNVPLGVAEWAAVAVASTWGQVAVGARRVVLAAAERRRNSARPGA
jgi:Ca2+-transporting ATPase